MWNDFNDLETAKRFILNPGYANTGQFPAADIPIKGKMDILDFGAGVGRNTRHLLSFGAKVSCYDFPNMKELAKQNLGADFYRISEWIEPPVTNLQDRKFDLVVATVVFQHIPEEALRTIFPVLNNCLSEDGNLFVHSRGYLDTGGNVWRILLDYFVPCHEFNEQDSSENHQAVTFKRKA